MPDPSQIHHKLASDKERDRLDAIQRLKAMGRASLPLLIALLNDPVPSVRVSSIRVLAQLGDDSVSWQLLEHLNDPSLDVVEAVIDALGALGSQGAAPALIQKLGSEHTIIRVASARALGSIRSTVAVPKLQVLSREDPHMPVRKAAEQALQAITRFEARSNPRLSAWKSLPQKQLFRPRNIFAATLIYLVLCAISMWAGLSFDISMFAKQPSVISPAAGLPTALPAALPTSFPPADINMIRLEMVDQLKGHSATVTSVAVSPDGTRIASASSGAPSVILWQSGESISQLAQLNSPSPIEFASDVAFSPDNRYLAAAYSLGDVRLWDMRSQQPVSVIHHSSGITALAFSPDAESLTSGTNGGEISRWSIPDGTLIDLTTHDVQTEITDLVYSPIGDLLAVAITSRFDVYRVSEMRSVSTTITARSDTFRPVLVAFLPDGVQIIAATGGGSGISVWDPTGSLIRDLSAPYNYICLALSPDGHLIAAGSDDGHITFWSTSLWQELATLKIEGSAVSDLQFSPDGRRLIGAVDNLVIVWEIGNVELD